MGKKQNSRGKAWRRHKDYSKAKRKKTISDEVYYWPYGWSYYDNLHQYSKNKIHCSCPMCRDKSKNRGAAALFHGTSNPTMMNLRRQLSMDDDYLEYFDDID